MRCNDSGPTRYAVRLESNRESQAPLAMLRHAFQ
jgi:hypothetical protein